MTKQMLRQSPVVALCHEIIPILIAVKESHQAYWKAKGYPKFTQFCWAHFYFPAILLTPKGR